MTRCYLFIFVKCGNVIMKFRENIQQQNMYHNTERWNVQAVQRCSYIPLIYFISKNREAFGTGCLFSWRPAKEHSFLAGGIVFPLTCTRWPAFLSGPHPDFDLLMIQLKAVTRFHNNNTERGCREAQVKQFLKAINAQVKSWGNKPSAALR